MHNILVLAGGGVRGLLSIQVLRYIERIARLPVCSLFQGVYGTSTGAVQAAALVNPRPLSAVNLERSYETLCGNVFDKRFWSLNGFAGPLYSAETLTAELQKVLGDRPLSDSLTHFGCVTYTLEAREPVLLSSYGVGSSWKFWQAALASSSAPTFFPAYDGRWWDGGLCANMPSAWAAIDYAKTHKVPLSEISVLAIGTGTHELPIRGAANKGKIGLVADVIDTAISGSQDLADIYCRSLGLGNYLQLQIKLPDEAAAMDDVSPENLLRLKRLGNQMVADQLVRVNQFIKGLASPAINSATLAR
jgi:patatin-like phospholipase/acyl hydrolase